MSSSPSPEVHAGDQSVIEDARRECELDVTAGDHRVPREYKRVGKRVYTCVKQTI